MSVGDIPAICWLCVMLLELIEGPLETKELSLSVFYVRWRHSALGWPWVMLLEPIAARWRPKSLVGVYSMSVGDILSSVGLE